MGLRTLHSTLCLLLLSCPSDGQVDLLRRDWRDRFVSFDRAYPFMFPNVKDTVETRPRFTLLAPDLLRTDSQENIYLQADAQSSPVTVTVSVQDFSQTLTLLLDSVTLSVDNGFQALKTIQVSSDRLNRDEKKNKFVYLKVDFGGLHTEERLLMVSFHSGYIFIQTDKPIYNPGDTVRFRAFVSSPSFKAFESSITMDFKNPSGVVVKQIFRTRAAGGVLADTFPLSEYVNEGTWTVIARFNHWEQNTFTSQFEVKKYVLPAFNVTLTPRKSFLSLDDSGLEVEVSARYLYGEPVQGTAYVVFGLKIDSEKTRLPSVKKVTDLEGGVVRLGVEEIKRAYPNMGSLVGHSVYVKASVLTETGSDLVEAEKSGIKIVKSPFVLSFKIPKYFKPGLPLDFTIRVSHHDGSPARNVEVKVNLLDAPLAVTSGAARATINMPDVQKRQTITAETTQAGLRPDQQARHQAVVEPYRSFKPHQGNYLYISMGTDTASVGDNLSLRLTIKVAETTDRDAVKHVTYLVLSKGRIVSAGRVPVSGQLVTAVPLAVVPEMMPSFRFVAFYSIPWARLEEVVSDSVWVDVVNSCVGGLKVGPVDGVFRDFAPGKRFVFQVRGDPGAKVSLVAVDNAVYLLNKDRLSQRKMWNVVEHGDFGCTRGGGEDAKAVFRNAGLLFSSSGGFKSGVRQYLQCPGSPRRRRSAELLQRKTQLESHYQGALQQRCCKDGLRDVPMPYSCTRRSFYITEGWECIRAFRYCCSTLRGQPFDTEAPTTPPPPTASAPPRHTFRWTAMSLSPRHGLVPVVRHRTMDSKRFMTANVKVTREELPVVGEEEEEEEEGEEEEEEYLDETEVYLRSKFYDSWLWMNVELPSTADADGLATKNIENALPDSITEWGVMAVSASPETGFCVAEPYDVRAWKRFFVDLKLPYSVARNEQVEIKAVIHNYGHDDLHVRVVLMKTEDMCSIAFKDRHTQEVTLPAGTSKAVRYTIMPLVAGRLPLEVMVVGRDMSGGDRVQKFLRVVMDGVQKTEVQSSVLNPSAEGGTQTIRFKRVALESVVPNSVPETFINIRGNVLADSIDNSISEDSLASLIQMPGGCVEQNLARITLPLIATLYLERTKGWESVGVQRKAEAIRYIRRGYENQLAYRKNDGSYPPYRREGASTWITAYVVKVFSMAHSIVGIDEQQVCDPLIYLVKNKHRSASGKMVEDNPVYSTTMTGGLKGGDPELTLTAFVLVALAEAKQAAILCTSPGVNLDLVINKMAEYLRASLSSPGRRPYTVAIASYALALVGKQRLNVMWLLRAASPDGSHWPDKHNHLFTLEGTGYALLALLKAGDLERAAVAFNWLNGQRRRGGGFGSTQSTMVVLQALSEYQISKPPPADLRLDVDVRIAGRRETRFHFNPSTAYAARSSRLPANLALEVEARGNGQGILEVVTYYNQLHEVDEGRACEHFELSVNIQEASAKPPADVEKSFLITIKVRALGPRDVRMVVLDVSLPTGFSPENSDLEMLSNSVDRYINNFQIVDNLSDRGSLIIHLLKVSHKEPEILIFRLQQSFRVGVLQPSSVTVYEYYSPDHRCTRTYSPREDKEELTQICRDNICRCTQGDCCVSKADSDNFSTSDRETFACKSLHHVFQVKVLSVNQSYYDKYEVEITQVIKLGLEDGVEVGQKRTFMSHGGCREGLTLASGSQYLVMGPRVDCWNIDSDTNRYIYMLGKDTWVERWPSSAECSVTQSLKCKELGDTARELSVNGCRL